MKQSGRWAEYASLYRNRDFRWLFTAKIVSTFGDNLYWVAAMWLVYSLTDSTFYTGLTAILSRGPGMFGFLTGPAVDRFDPRQILIKIELVQMLIVLAVPITAAFGLLNIAVVLAVVPLLSFASQFSRPAERVALPRVVDDSRIVKANSIFKFTYRGTQAAAKSVAGVLMGVVGAVALYAINAVTFLSGAILFSQICTLTAESDGSQSDGDESSLERLRQYGRELRAGLPVVRHLPVFHIIVGATIANFLNGISIAILPAFASTFTGATAYGLLYGGMGAGLFIGAGLVSALEHRSFGWTSAVLFLVAGAFWTSSILVPSLELTITFFTLAWIPIGVFNILSISVIQIGVADSVLGRVTSLNASLTSLASALGLLFGGFVGENTHSANLMLFAGLGFLVISLYWGVIPSARSISATSDIEEDSFKATGQYDD